MSNSSGSAFNPHQEVHANLTDLCQSALNHMLGIIQEKAAANAKPCSIALSGGSTPKLLYRMMKEQCLDELSGGKVTFYIGDDRVVLPTDERSNLKMATDELLHAIPKEYIFAPDLEGVLLADGGKLAIDAGEEGSLRSHDENDIAAARVSEQYETVLREQLPCVPFKFATPNTDSMETVPEFDIVLLGLGSDGHTGSIFPGSSALSDTAHAVCAGYPSETMVPKVSRFTVTPAVICHAKHVVLLAAGKDKHWVLEGILGERAREGGDQLYLQATDSPATGIPVAQFLRLCHGKVWLILDEGIAHGGEASK